MATKPVKVAFLADTADLRTNLSKAESAMNDAAAEARTAGQKIDSAFDAAGEGSDKVATASAQAAGGIGDVGGAMSAMGFISEGTAEKMDKYSQVIMGVTGVSDLANVVTEKFKLSMIRAKVATVAQTIASKASAAATKAMAIAQRVLNVAMRANPIGLIITALALLVAGVVLAYKKSETFRKIVDKAFDLVKKAAKKVADFFIHDIPDAFRKIMEWAGRAKDWVVDKFSDMIQFVRDLPGKVRDVASRLWDSIVDKADSAKDWVVDKFDRIVDFVQNLPGRIGRAASGMWNGIKDAFKSAINGVISLWNNLGFSIPGFDWPGPGSFPGISISTPNIPYLAGGGITTGPTIALIGDNPGGREAIVPLDKYSLGGNTYEITVVAPVGSSSADIGRELAKHIDAYERAGGRRRR